MRILGLDLGTKTLGVAISDPLELIATGLTTIRFEENSYKDSLKELRSIIDEYNVKAIVIGLPKNMNNSLGFAAERTKEFEIILEE